jgi:hypothetical protein
MASAQINFPAVPSGITLEKYAVTVLPQEVEFYLQATALQEYEQQRELGQLPTSIRIDGRVELDVSAIATAKRRVQLSYGSAEQVVAAARLAIEQMIRLTPIGETGHGRASFRVFLNSSELGGPEVLDSDALANAIKSTDVLRVVGPTVPYGRKLAWRSGKFKTVNVRAGRGVRVRMTGVRRNTPEVVRALVRSRFPALNVSDPWISTRYFRGIGSDDRTPSIAISMKRRGKLQ